MTTRGTGPRHLVAVSTPTRTPGPSENIPPVGTIGWLRAWYGPRFIVGRQARVNGERVKILSAQPDGRVAVRLWHTGLRMLVKPAQVWFDDDDA